MSPMLTGAACASLEGAPQRLEPVVPLGAHRLDPAGGLVERLRAELVVRLAADALRADQFRAAEGREMLGDRLPCDRQLGREPARRDRAAMGERLHQTAARRVGERIEDRVDLSVGRRPQATSVSLEMWQSLVSRGPQPPNAIPVGPIGVSTTVTREPPGRASILNSTKLSPW